MPHGLLSKMSAKSAGGVAERGVGCVGSPWAIGLACAAGVAEGARSVKSFAPVPADDAPQAESTAAKVNRQAKIWYLLSLVCNAMTSIPKQSIPQSASPGFHSVGTEGHPRVSEPHLAPGPRAYDWPVLYSAPSMVGTRAGGKRVRVVVSDGSGWEAQATSGRCMMGIRGGCGR